MSLRDVLRTLVRRWFLVLPAIIVALAAALEVFLVVSPTYQVQARLLLLPSAASSGPVSGTGNPYLSLSAGLGQTAQVIALAVTDEKSITALSALGANAPFTVVLDPAANAPIIRVTASSTDPVAAQRTLGLVEQRIRAQLLNAQVAASAPKNSLITLSLLTQSSQPKKIAKVQLRDGIAAGIGTLIVLMIPIFLFERAILARKNKQRAAGDIRVDSETPERLLDPRHGVEPVNVGSAAGASAEVNGELHPEPATDEPLTVEPRAGAATHENAKDEDESEDQTAVGLENEDEAVVEDSDGDAVVGGDDSNHAGVDDDGPGNTANERSASSLRVVAF